jgi:hypothetical protein
MKLPLVATRLIIIAFKLMVAAIVVLSILPLLTGGIGLDMDDGSEGGMTLDGSVIRVQMPITVRNDGTFDINDLQVSFIFMNEDGDVLAESEGEQMDIPAGRETEITIGLALDLLDLERQVRSDLIFNGTEMIFDATISAKYTLDMVQLSVEVGSDMEWGPFVSDLQVEAWNAQAMEEGGERYMYVPYSFQADDVLAGLETLTITEYRDESGYSSNITQSVQLSPQVNEMAKIPLSQEAYNRYINGTANATVRTTLYVLDCSTYDQEGLVAGGGGGGGGADPVRDLNVQLFNSYLQEMGGEYYVVMPYSFNTDPAYQGQEAQVLIEYWDEHGFTTNTWQTVNLWDGSWYEPWLPLSQEAYDRVLNNDELVHVRVTVYHQSWNTFVEESYHEPWGVGP